MIRVNTQFEGSEQGNSTCETIMGACNVYSER